ncbi:MAG: DUF4926 domain-containing protein [Phycisphaerales bacterium]|nr:MAG: DUF4926 domain-containing protein [Phycisphaerales bacterium]
MNEHDRVVLRADLPAEGLKCGDVGTIVHVYRDRKAYEVEFITLEGETVAVLTLETDQVRPIKPGEITHARDRAA